MDAAPTISGLEAVAANLRLILRGLLAGLGTWRIAPTLAIVAHRRITGTFTRIERLMIRFRAGRLWRMQQRAATSARLSRGACATRLPSRFGWLVQAGGYQAVGFGLQLHSVFSTPEMTELLAASAQARRILRPLCRALAMDLPGTVAAAPKPATDCSEVPRRVRKPRAKPEPFRIPLPRGVLSAARRQGFGKDRG